jgi:hypothetical protein
MPSRLAVILNRQTGWLTNTWTPPDSYPNSEIPIRGAASAAVALAVCLQSQIFDAGVSGVPNYRTPRDRATKIATDIAAAHRATTAGGWGGTWQSALWAWLSGLAGWLHWRYLSATDRQHVLAMIEDEANVRLGTPPRYLRGPDGTVLTPGDSGAEEDAWNVLAPALGYAMMPGHPNAARWLQRAAELAAAALAHPNDVTSRTVVSARPISEWVDGSNVESNYSITNHNRAPHPDYMAASHLLAWAAATLSLAGRPVPRVFLWNYDRVYAAMSAPIFRGQAIYRPGEPSPIINYPAGYDWGNRRPTNLAAFDIGAVVYRMDGRSARPAGYWVDQHLQDADTMQQRFGDGHLVLDNTEDSYAAREQWDAAQVAVSALLLWLDAHGRIRVTDAPL